MAYIFNPFVNKITIQGTGGDDDRLKDVSTLPTLPAITATYVSGGNLVDPIPMLSAQMGVTATEILVANNHLDVENPCDMAVSLEGPLYADSDDIWMYAEGNWMGLAGISGIPYRGIVNTKPTTSLSDGVYVYKADSYDKVYKARKMKTVHTAYYVQGGSVTNFNDELKDDGVETIEFEYAWANHTDVPEPIESTDFYVHIYILLDGMWWYKGGSWTDIPASKGLTWTNVFITEPPTADMAEGFYTLSTEVLGAVQFGVPLSSHELVELYQLDMIPTNELEFYICTGADIQSLKAFANQAGLTIEGYKIIDDVSDIVESDTTHVYIIPSIQTGYLYTGEWTPIQYVLVDDISQINEAGCYGCYKKKSGWGSVRAKIDELQNKILADESKINFFDYAELNCTSGEIKVISVSNEKITTLDIPRFVTSIGDNAFKDCKNLTTITIPNSVTSILGSPFHQNITRIYITDISAWCNIEFETKFSSPTYYMRNLYLNNRLVVDLVIPDGVTTIKKYAFNGYHTLKSLTIPNSVTSIGYCAFQNCSNLTSITFNGTKDEWNAITKGFIWNEDTGNYTIHCTDGDIAKE